MGKYEKLHDLIAESASEVLDKMFYKKIEPVKEDVIFPYEVIVTIGFNGKYNGTFWIVLSEALCFQLSSSFLDMDESELDKELVHDTTKEIINMICGNVLFNFDKSKKFDITIPSIFVEPNTKDYVLTIPNSAYSFSFKIDDIPLKMILHLTM
jgi:CheY-specific phosphatase CheX